MADFEIRPPDLVLHLSAGEKVASLSGDVTVPLAQIESVDVVEHAWQHVHGMRVGTGLPGVLIAGTFYSGDDHEMVAVCHRSKPGVLVMCKGASPHVLIASTDDPQPVVDAIRAAAGLA